MARPAVIPVAGAPCDTPETPAAKALLFKRDAATNIAAQTSAPADPDGAKAGAAAPPPGNPPTNKQM